jgi:Tfp pilus assembly protein PilE
MTIPHQQRKHRGLTLMGLIITLFVVILVLLFAMKLVPAYMEYATAKNAIQAIARDRQNATAHEIRRSFESRAAIDDISTIKATDLDITREGGEIVIAFAYRKEVPLFSNVGVYIDFAANSKGQ